MDMENKIQADIVDWNCAVKLSADQFKRQVSDRSIELLKLAESLAGSAVLLAKSNSVSALIDIFAIWKCGACVIPIADNSSDIELENLKKLTEAKILIGENREEIFNVSNNDEYKNLALVLFTSGTTGQAKGVKISFDNLNQKIATLEKFINKSEIENSFCALPTYFGHGLICNTLFPMFHGKKFVIVKNFSIEFISGLKKFIEKEKINFFSTVPSVWNLILSFGNNDGLTNSLKRVHCASASLSLEKTKSILTWTDGARFFDVYGITELLGWIALREITLEIKQEESVFEIFFDVEVETKDDELVVKSKYMAEGYFKNLYTLKDDKGFFHTGDIFSGKKLIGRKKEVVNKGGFKIYNNEIDLFVNNSGLVKDCCSFGIPDDFSGERLGLAFVISENKTKDDLKRYLEKNLSRYKCPDVYLELKAIPRTSRGKINREVFLGMIKDE